MIAPGAVNLSIQTGTTTCERMESACLTTPAVRRSPGGSMRAVSPPKGPPRRWPTRARSSRTTIHVRSTVRRRVTDERSGRSRPMTDLGTKALQQLLRETEKRLGLIQSIDQEAKDLLRLKKFIQRIA